ENGQYEVDLGPNAPGGEKALPPVPGGAEDRQSRERAERAADEPRSSRGGRGGRGRDRERDEGGDATPRPESGMVLAEGFELLKKVLVEFGATNGTPA